MEMSHLKIVIGSTNKFSGVSMSFSLVINARHSRVLNFTLHRFCCKLVLHCLMF